MKKLLLTIWAIGMLSALAFKSQAQIRYVNDMFTDVVKQSNIVYDSNRSINILYGKVPGQLPIITVNLKCDVYTPSGDAVTKRPVVIVAGTGSYLPAIVNNQTTGNKNDSAIVEICTRFAKKGYVAVAVDYRQGWNPLTTVQADAAEQLIKATFRALQDVRNCIRYLRVNASTYGIDTAKIVVGGQGTGGYVALALASVNKRPEIESNPKFLRGDFTPMVNIDTLGDWNGLGGVALPAYPYYFNYSGDPAVSANAHMVFNYGGAIGDSTWVDNATLPIVGIHSTTDIFAPYKTGNVVVPTTGLVVIPSASGAGALIPYVNSMGINNKINAAKYNDPYSLRAMAVSGGVKSLFPIIAPTPGNGAPWEWWDRASMQSINSVVVNGIPIPASGHVADSLSMLTNPTMSAAQGKAYIDTIVNFLAPRIAVQFDYYLGDTSDHTGIQSVSPINDLLAVYPNPAHDHLTVSLPLSIQQVSLLDITGKTIMESAIDGLKKASFDISNLQSGMYFVRAVATDGRVATKRIVVN